MAEPTIEEQDELNEWHDAMADAKVPRMVMSNPAPSKAKKRQSRAGAGRG